MSEETVGDAGPSTLGYYGGAFAPDGRGILAHSYSGALHHWRRPGALLHLFAFGAFQQIFQLGVDVNLVNRICFSVPAILSHTVRASAAAPTPRSVGQMDQTRILSCLLGTVCISQS